MIDEPTNVKRIYSWILNQTQYFTYGRTWFNIPLSILSISSSIGVLLLYAGVERSYGLLVIISGFFLSGIYILGRVLFVTGGQQQDQIMMAWRNPATMLSTVSFLWATSLNAEKNEIPVPEELREFGVIEWSNLYPIYRYMLKMGVQAGALPLCKKMLQDSPENS